MTEASRDLSRARGAWGARVAAAVLLTVGLFPIATWIAGGHDAALWPGLVRLWSSGGAIVLGLAVVGTIVTGRLGWRDGAVRAPLARLAARPRSLAVLGAALSFALAAWTARALFNGRPLLIDEIAQLLHARALVAGRLTTPVTVPQEFVAILHTLYRDGVAFSQFPVGGPAMLALGELAGAAWLVNPLCAALAAYAFAYLVRRLAPEGSVQAGAVLCLVLSPFFWFMAASHMNHVPALLFVTLAMAALARVTREGEAPGASEAAMPGDARAGAAFACGLALGAAATVRPVDAAAFALPAGLWLFARAVKARTRARVVELLASGLGVAIPASLLMLANARTTGAPLLFGYDLLWGPAHGLGFHDAPWGGAPHSPARGLELVNLYLLRLQAYVFEAPVPSLLLATAGLLLARRLSAFDRYLLASAALVLVAYFAYWHDGFYLGPRFMYALLPAIALWTARGLAAIRERTGAGSALHRATCMAVVAAIVVGATTLLPERWRQYTNGFSLERWDVQQASDAAGVRGALVLVRESWESQLVVRMWALGIPHPDAEALRSQVDACALEQGLARVERTGERGAAALAALQPLRADSSRVSFLQRPSGVVMHVIPGRSYAGVCGQRVLEGDAGVAPLAPVLLAQGDARDNVFVRDLHARDTLLSRHYAGRPLWLLTRDVSRPGAPPQFSRPSRDSLAREWGISAERLGRAGLVSVPR